MRRYTYCLFYNIFFVQNTIRHMKLRRNAIFDLLNLEINQLKCPISAFTALFSTKSDQKFIKKGAKSSFIIRCGGTPSIHLSTHNSMSGIIQKIKKSPSYFGWISLPIQELQEYLAPIRALQYFQPA